MDQLTEDLLKTWNLGEYVSVFRDGRVDAPVLRLLAHDEIVQLIPSPGDRARFRVNLENWKQEVSALTPQSLKSNCGTGVEEQASFSLLGNELDTSIGSLGTLLRETNSYGANLDLTFIPLESSSTPIPETPSSRPSLSADTHGGTSTEPGYVLRTLNSSLDGKSILGQGKIEGKLSENQRNLLVRLLILPMFEKSPNIQINNTQLLGWSLEIQEIFTRESPAVYYTPYISASVRNTARNASGKLLRFIYNRRRIMRDRGILETRSRSTSRASSSDTRHSHATRNTDIDSDVIAEKLKWLHCSLEPWHLVEENWNATANYRLSENYSSGGSVHDYFSEYPVLKRPTGYQLLINDFKVLYEDKCDALFTNIVWLREKIFGLAKKHGKSVRDKDIQHTIEKYMSAANDPNCQEGVNNAALLLLPYLTSSVPLKEKRKTTWKPSKSEVRDGFVTQIASDSELETTIASRKSKLERFGKTLQPFVIFVGQDIVNVLHSYVFVADTFYRFDTILLAVDACFKIIQATGARYQDEALVVWMVIQKAFYKIETKHDKELTTVNSLLVELRNDC